MEVSLIAVARACAGEKRSVVGVKRVAHVTGGVEKVARMLWGEVDGFGWGDAWVGVEQVAPRSAGWGVF